MNGEREGREGITVCSNQGNEIEGFILNRVFIFGRI